MTWLQAQMFKFYFTQVYDYKTCVRTTLVIPCELTYFCPKERLRPLKSGSRSGFTTLENVH